MLTNKPFDLKTIWEIELGIIKKQLAKIASRRIQLSQKLQQLIKTTNKDINQFIKKYIDSLADHKISAQEYKYLNELWAVISVNTETIFSLWENPDKKIYETRLNEFSEALSQDPSSLFSTI